MKASWTAQGAAAQRAVLTDLGVLHDRLARRMLDRSWRALAWTVGHAPRRALGRAVTLAGAAGSDAWFDRTTADALDDGIALVVTLGAGYDTRAWRFARPGVRFVELDHPATQAEKVRRAPAGPGPTFVVADLGADRPSAALDRSGVELDGPVLFVLESVAMYLAEATVRDLVADLASRAAPGSRLAINVLPRTTPATAQQRRQLALQRAVRLGGDESFRCRLDPDEAEALLRDAGWDVVERCSFRDAATTLVPPGSGLPVDAVDPNKTLLLGELSRRV